MKSGPSPSRSWRFLTWSRCPSGPSFRWEPDVDLGEFRTIRVDAPPVEISDEDVNRVLENLRYESAPWEPAETPGGLW